MLAIVTAGDSAIGKSLVLGLAQAGWKVAFSYFGPSAASDALLDAVHAAGGSARAWGCDAADEQAVIAFHAEACAWAGVAAPKALINCAGIQTWAPLMELEVEDWDRVINTNMRGTFLNTRTAARAMKAAGHGGAIVNFGSGCSKLAFPRLVAYTASKGGIEQLTKVSAAELGPYGIRVNCIAPGAIATERTALESPDYDGDWAKITPLRRVGQTQDLVGPMLFLISEASAFVSGQTLWVDGGVFSQAAWPYEVTP